jgi:hypothetical protein
VAVCVVAAEVFEGVRREIDDDEASTGAENACGLVEGARRVVEEVEDLVDEWSA